MNYVESIQKSAKHIERKVRLMEVCGTHTVSIFRAGIRQILPANVELVSGPGCPVCVTNDDFLDKAIEYSKNPDVIIATFGDMLKVPGSRESLADSTGNIKVIYSPLDAIELARNNPNKKVIFLAVGFETTSPTAAATVLAAKNENLSNLFFLSAQKLVPPALKNLLADPKSRIDGLILPGHVAVVIGTDVFKFVADEFKIPGVVAGFKPNEILRAIDRLLIRIDENDPAIENCYESVVRSEGNPNARKILETVYKIANAEWRGLGLIENSGLQMKFEQFDIEKVMPVQIPAVEKNKNCRCGEILSGSIIPTQCKLFGKLCKPDHAVGPCMASIEGTCSAWFRYGGFRFEF